MPGRRARWPATSVPPRINRTRPDRAPLRRRTNRIPAGRQTRVERAGVGAVCQIASSPWRRHLQQHAVRVLPLRNRHAALPRVVFVRVRGDAGDAPACCSARSTLAAVRRANPGRAQGARRGVAKQAAPDFLGLVLLKILSDGAGLALAAPVLVPDWLPRSVGIGVALLGRSAFVENCAQTFSTGRGATRSGGCPRDHRLRPHAGVHGALRGVRDAFAGAVRRRDSAVLFFATILPAFGAAGKKVD